MSSSYDDHNKQRYGRTIEEEIAALRQRILDLEIERDIYRENGYVLRKVIDEMTKEREVIGDEKYKLELSLKSMYDELRSYKDTTHNKTTAHPLVREWIESGLNPYGVKPPSDDNNDSDSSNALTAASLRRGNSNVDDDADADNVLTAASPRGIDATHEDRRASTHETGDHPKD